MNRSLVLTSVVILISTLLLSRLFYLQIIDSSNKNPLNSSTVKSVYNYPNRGYIYDRNGKLLVANQPSYDIMVIPKEMRNIDTLKLCKTLGISKEIFNLRVKAARNYSSHLPSVFIRQLTKIEYAKIQEKMFNFQGFYIQKRFIREYPIKSGANFLGFISEVKEGLIKKNPYYQLGELIGTAGVEKSYEQQLRGVKGVKFIQRDRFNREIGTYKEGMYDTLPVPGKDLTLTIDSEIQHYAEQLMKNKRGGIVAIEPSSGEILALVSAPTYDPNLLVGRNRSKNFNKLFKNTFEKPMLDRALQAQYSPGSPFKIINGLIGLQEDVITTTSYFKCYNGYKYGKKAFMGCHCGIYNSPIRLKTAISKSCNSYFANTYKKIIQKYNSSSEGLDAWNKHVESFGLGNFLGYDLPIGRKGFIPNGPFYDKYYPNGRWRAVTTISNAIGQGEILTTPIQLANMTAAIANKGFYYKPHIVKKIKNHTADTIYKTKIHTTISPNNFEPIIQAMYDVFENGTARGSKINGIEICGKTGTVQNYTYVNGKRIELKDHSIFIAFAPKENPKIAIAIFVENGGYGSTIAAPITSLMI